MRRARLIVAAAALFAAALAVGQALRAVPPLEARVTDLASVLAADERAAIERRLAELEARTGSQVAVLLVPSTRPEAIEQYALRVVEAWQLGRGEVDDGALLLVALEDRELRIEVGYGLEGAIPDARANRIIDDYITPRFREGDFAAGINAGLDAVSAAIDGEALPPPAGQPGVVRDIDIGGMLPVLLIVAVALGGTLKRAFGSLPGAALTGGIVGIIAWFIVGIVATAVLAALIAFFISLFMAAGPGAWTSGGGYRGGFGGGHRGGFGRGGGFSGGGGGFGGGGASGSW